MANGNGSSRAAWGLAIGLLAVCGTVVGAVHSSDLERIKTIEAATISRSERVATVEARSVATDRRLDDIEKRLERIESKIDAIRIGRAR